MSASAPQGFRLYWKELLEGGKQPQQWHPQCLLPQGNLIGVGNTNTWELCKYGFDSSGKEAYNTTTIETNKQTNKSLSAFAPLYPQRFRLHWKEILEGGKQPQQWRQQLGLPWLMWLLKVPERNHSWPEKHKAPPLTHYTIYLYRKLYRMNVIDFTAITAMRSLLVGFASQIPCKEN